MKLKSQYQHQTAIFITVNIEILVLFIIMDYIIIEVMLDLPV